MITGLLVAVGLMVSYRLGRHYGYESGFDDGHVCRWEDLKEEFEEFFDVGGEIKVTGISPIDDILEEISLEAPPCADVDATDVNEVAA